LKMQSGKCTIDLNGELRFTAWLYPVGLLFEVRNKENTAKGKTTNKCNHLANANANSSKSKASKQTALCLVLGVD